MDRLWNYVSATVLLVVQYIIYAPVMAFNFIIHAPKLAIDFVFQRPSRILVPRRTTPWEVNTVSYRQGQSPFFARLPQEVKNQIYALVFRHDPIDPRIHAPVPFHYPLAPGFPVDHSMFAGEFRRSGVSLLMACRRVYDESYEIFAKATVVYFNVRPAGVHRTSFFEGLSRINLLSYFQEARSLVAEKWDPLPQPQNGSPRPYAPELDAVSRLATRLPLTRCLLPLPVPVLENAVFLFHTCTSAVDPYEVFRSFHREIERTTLFEFRNVEIYVLMDQTVLLEEFVPLLFALQRINMRGLRRCTIWLQVRGGFLNEAHSEATQELAEELEDAALYEPLPFSIEDGLGTFLPRTRGLLGENGDGGPIPYSYDHGVATMFFEMAFWDAYRQIF